MHCRQDIICYMTHLPHHCLQSFERCCAESALLHVRCNTCGRHGAPQQRECIAGHCQRISFVVVGRIGTLFPRLHVFNCHSIAHTQCVPGALLDVCLTKLRRTTNTRYVSWFKNDRNNSDQTERLRVANLPDVASYVSAGKALVFGHNGSGKHSDAVRALVLSDYFEALLLEHFHVSISVCIIFASIHRERTAIARRSPSQLQHCFGIFAN